VRKVAVALALLAAAKLAACTTFDDAAPANDADAGDASSESSAGACPAGAYCDDFERDDYHTGWTEEGKVTGVTVGIDDKVAHSAKRSVRFDIPAVTLDGKQYLTRGVPDLAARKIVVKYAARMTPSVNVTFLTIEMGAQSDSEYDTIALSAGDKGAQLLEVVNDVLDDGGVDYRPDSVTIPMPPDGAFRPYTLTLDLDAKTVTLVDDETAFKTEKPLKFVHGALRVVRFGIAYTATNTRPGDQKLWLDDIVIQ